MKMGLQVLEEFWPITPVRTHPRINQQHSSNTTMDPCCSQYSQQQQNDVEIEDIEECHTPTSPSTILTTPLVCPPPPKKLRKLLPPISPRPSQLFFQVPHDLASIFLPSTPTTS